MSLEQTAKTPPLSFFIAHLEGASFALLFLLTKAV